MQTPYVTYPEAMAELSTIARSSEPAYVRVRALCQITRELSPGNSAQRENHRALDLEPHPEPEPRPEPARPADPVPVHPALVEVSEIMARINEQAGIHTDDEENEDEEEEPQ